MTIASAKLVILDRDGVINRDSEAFVKTPEEWIPVDGSIEAIARLSQAGFRVAVATNQSGLARGLLTQDMLDAMHRKLHDLVEEQGGHVDGVFYCPHGPDEACPCRKPLPGLLHQIAETLAVKIEGVPMVGDSERDLLAAEAAGCKPVLVKTGKGLATMVNANPRLLARTQVFEDLAAFVDDLLFRSAP